MIKGLVDIPAGPFLVLGLGKPKSRGFIYVKIIYQNINSIVPLTKTYYIYL